ncbi:MAG: DNA methylase N-4/N-6 domain protein [Anaerolineaceae bacterium]|nr:MAG: DNA methylase N-4/N-6 domain protein [Anaerolineaceae bacterium]
MLKEIREKTRLTQSELAQQLGASFVSVNRWERGASEPSPAQQERIKNLYTTLTTSSHQLMPNNKLLFSSRGIRNQLPLFETSKNTQVELSDETQPPIISRLLHGKYFSVERENSIRKLLSKHTKPAFTVQSHPLNGMSAGKNTYTYDAHTYHTKVPPQGIAELLTHYLPKGGLVLDLFSGSGMTGVAALANGYDCILNELSPAACFIADRFVSHIEPSIFQAGVEKILDELKDLRKLLYTTQCRECGKNAEILYTVWSYNVICNQCSHEFLLWDYCRKYGQTVKEHKILSEFPCPNCGVVQKKSTLQRTTTHPVLLGYKCCKSLQQEVTLNEDDFNHLQFIEASPPLADDFFPKTVLGKGVNLRQPQKHGFDSVDKFYTSRNLAAMSHLWKTIHRVESRELAAYLAFVFTSLYQRVTRFSEYRFWGGSGNTARFNVPYIFNETNVFLTFIRKAKSIQDHLLSTSSKYTGEASVVCNTATSLDYLPGESVDLIFTDPPFGANINYSEMNILWESWLGAFTDKTEEAIINKFQNKGISEYQTLMTQSMKESYRVLRPGHWLLLVFMNSSSEIWKALRASIISAGFIIKNVNVFDKQHGTFKQFVSENTAGFDLVLHCLKPESTEQPITPIINLKNSVVDFLENSHNSLPTTVYLHVERQEELDFRKLYSEWLSLSLMSDSELMGFVSFRETVTNWINQRKGKELS